MEGLFGDYEAIRKSGLFDADYYLATYPDVAERNLDPLVHYLEEGSREGRNPHPEFDGTFYLEQCRLKGEQPANPLLHYIRIGAARGFKTRPNGVESGRIAGGQAQAAERAGTMPILVALESLSVVALPGGASRLSVGGWALATARISGITVALGGEVLGTAAYGFARPDVARLYPDREHALDSGFLLTVDLPGAVDGVIDPLLAVRTADGEIGQRPLRVEVPPREVSVPVVDPLAKAGGATPGADKTPIRLGIDNATVDTHGILRLEGWLLSRVQLESLTAFIDGAPLGKAEFGRVRADIEEAHPEYPNSRFAGVFFAADIGDHGFGRKTVSIRATARAGLAAAASTEVTIPRRPAGRATPDPGFRHHLDTILLTADGRLAIRGWAVSAAPTRAVVVLFDGEEIGRVEISVDRPEIGNLFPGLAHARQPGFAFDAHLATPPAGEHLLTVRACLADGQSRDISVPLAARVTRKWGTASAAEPDHRLQVDSPLVIDGGVESPVCGNLEVSGWALAKAGVAAIEIAVDGAPIAIADYGLRRLDIRAAFPDWQDALGSGFQALLPHRMLPRGRHTVSVTLRDKAARTSAAEFRIEVEALSDEFGPWSLRRKMPQAEIELADRILDRCGRRPTFVAILPVDDPSTPGASLTIASLGTQAYADWRLLLVPQRRAGKRAAAAADALAAVGGRGEVLHMPTPQTLAQIARRLGVPAGEMFITVLAPGDELGCDAFLELAMATAPHHGADFLYSDERSRNPASGTVEAYFKPQWSPDLMASTNYIGRLWCVRADLLAAVAEPSEALLRHGEYDLVLRCTEKAKAIRHVPAVLCERAAQGLDDAAQAKAALERMLARRGIKGDVRAGPVAGTYWVRRPLAQPGLVSIVIATCAARGMIETCIGSLRRLTAYRNYEIICIENIPPAERSRLTWLRANTDRVISADEPFNWSRYNNRAAAQANGEYLLFLNDDTEVVEPDWLDTLLEQAQRPEVGVVGALLLYPDRRIQHAGMFLAAVGQARHAFRYLAEDDPGYFGLAHTQRNVIAVTGACFLTRRETFAALGGFNEAHGIINNDVDYCLRAWQSGLLNVYTPHARLIHHEAISRAALEDEYDTAAFDGRWRRLFIAGDPFFNPHLSKAQDDFAVDHEPTRLSVIGGPVLRRDEIRKILVVKLDHIGDCIIAFPAVRHLKQLFPEARISVLTSRASRPVWAYEAAVEHVIEFEFFNPRSSLGEIEHSEEEWRELGERLASERFDLAVDLRKHTETRPVLSHTGARYLAGFDYRGQFPWLDIALEWGGDPLFARKRQWTGDDLVNLIDAIAAACRTDRAVITDAMAPLAERGAHAATGNPVVWVHPTAGNEIKQWPIEYFAVVIDQLVEAHGARVFLTGAPGDEVVAAAILRRLRHPEAVTSLIGKSPLARLPELMRGASLFLGNDSGLKHIAAGLGIPTVGIHGGTLDPREWGPVGPAAVAVSRSVVCSPCYLSKIEDCRRALACLWQLEPAQVYEACRRLLLLEAPAQPARRPEAAARLPETEARAQASRARKRPSTRTVAGTRIVPAGPS